MSIRFSDNILNNIEDSGFVVRNRVPRSMQIFLIFLAAFDLICFSAYLTEDTTVNGVFLAILVVSIGSLGCATLFFMAKFRNLILATEFQASMMASATQIGTRFCFITSTDGTIFYVDPGFQKVFSNFINNGSKTLRELFAFTDIPDEVRKKVFETLKSNRSDHVVLAFNDGQGNLMTMMTTIDVIPRPRGYFIIRGRDYVEKRVDDGGAKDVDKNSALLLKEALCNVAGAMVVADNHGKIVSVNHEFEQWLGYDKGEIVQSKAMLGQIFYQYIGHDTGILLLSDFDGQVIVKRKNRAMITMKTHQKLLADAHQTLGISATIELQNTI